MIKKLKPFSDCSFLITGCQSLFLKQIQSGKCIKSSEELVYNDVTHALPYFVVMADNCLDVKAQFRYLHNDLLHNIKKAGTLVSPLPKNSKYKGRWAVYKGVSSTGRNYQNNLKHRLKQTDFGSLRLEQDEICAELSKTYLMRKTYCNNLEQMFTFGMSNMLL